MITLIGTGHVFDLSKALLAIFEEKEPDVVCVELDRQRYHALILRTTNPAAYEESKKNLPIVYKMLAQFQESMAQQYGVNAGDEMLTAITYAQSHQLPVEFIDKDAQNLFSTMWKTMPFLEKLKLLFSGLGGLFISKKRVEKELENLQGNFDTYLEEIGKRFPTIKRTLIDERNEYMVSRVATLNDNYHKIIVCIGDGHIPGMTALLSTKQIPYEVIRLQQLQNQKTINADGISAGFSIQYKPI